MDGTERPEREHIDLGNGVALEDNVTWMAFGCGI
jgi:hypothetical protein